LLLLLLLLLVPTLRVSVRVLEGGNGGVGGAVERRGSDRRRNRLQALRDRAHLHDSRTGSCGYRLSLLSAIVLRGNRSNRTMIAKRIPRIPRRREATSTTQGLGLGTRMPQRHSMIRGRRTIAAGRVSRRRVRCLLWQMRRPSRVVHCFVRKDCRGAGRATWGGLAKANRNECSQKRGNGEATVYVEISTNSTGMSRTQ
jgi:hypothetical protein